MDTSSRRDNYPRCVPALLKSWPLSILYLSSRSFLFFLVILLIISSTSTVFCDGCYLSYVAAKALIAKEHSYMPRSFSSALIEHGARGSGGGFFKPSLLFPKFGQSIAKTKFPDIAMFLFYDPYEPLPVNNRGEINETFSSFSRAL